MSLYASQDWQKMISLGTYSIKDMLNKDATSGEDSQPSKQTASTTKGRKRNNQSDTNDDENSQKLKDGARVKSSSNKKQGSQSSEMELKTILTDCSLLMPERVESGQV